jgi:hypothetical protein
MARNDMTFLPLRLSARFGAWVAQRRDQSHAIMNSPPQINSEYLFVSQCDLIDSHQCGIGVKMQLCKALAITKSAGRLKLVAARNVAYWHLASFRCAAEIGRYWRRSGHWPELALNASVANDPSRHFATGN